MCDWDRTRVLRKWFMLVVTFTPFLKLLFCHRTFVFFGVQYVWVLEICFLFNSHVYSWIDTILRLRKENALATLAPAPGSTMQAAGFAKTTIVAEGYWKVILKWSVGILDCCPDMADWNKLHCELLITGINLWSLKKIHHSIFEYLNDESWLSGALKSMVTSILLKIWMVKFQNLHMAFIKSKYFYLKYLLFKVICKFWRNLLISKYNLHKSPIQSIYLFSLKIYMFHWHSASIATDQNSIGLKRFTIQLEFNKTWLCVLTRFHITSNYRQNGILIWESGGLYYTLLEVSTHKIQMLSRKRSYRWLDSRINDFR